MLKKIKNKRESEKTNVNFRATKDELDKIKKLAKKYAGGNLTAWLKYTAINYKPKKSELENED